MARTKTDRGKVVDTKELASVCTQCGEGFEALIRIYENGDEITACSGRCDKCQTKHLANNRLGQFMHNIKGLRNMKARLSPSQRDMLIKKVSNEISSLLDYYQNVTTVRADGFDIGD